MRYEDKLRQANREARAALIGLVATIVVWAACGFGLAPSGVYICATPLWVVAGCGATFLFSVGVAVWMACHVMKDVGLDDVSAGEDADGRCARDGRDENAGAGECGGAGKGATGGEIRGRAAGTGEDTQGRTSANRVEEGARP